MSNTSTSSSNPIRSGRFSSISTTQERPFVLDLRYLDEADKTGMPPIGGVLLTRGLRTSGLLSALPALDLKNLLYMFTFATAYGLGRPTTLQLARAMNTSEAKVRARMDRLTRFDWQGHPLVRLVRRSDGEDLYMLSPDLLQIRERPLQSDNYQRLNQLNQKDDVVPMPVGHESAHQLKSVEASENHKPMSVGPSPIGTLVRDRIIAHSRARYSRPRAEVETNINRAMGWDKPKSTATGIRPDGGDKQTIQTPQEVDEIRHALRRQLLEVGITGRLADELLDRYPADQIRQQLDWLPHRNAKNPARLIVAAIEGRYAAPAAVRFNKPLKHQNS